MTRPISYSATFCLLPDTGSGEVQLSDPLGGGSVWSLAFMRRVLTRAAPFAPFKAQTPAVVRACVGEPWLLDDWRGRGGRGGLWRGVESELWARVEAITKGWYQLEPLGQGGAGCDC